jgi:O-antigen ligase
MDLANLSSGQYLQLILALTLGIIVFIGIYAIPEKIVIGSLVIIIPFQPVVSAFGSINMMLVYLTAFAFMLRGRIKYLPMLGWVMALLFVYFISMSQAPPYTRFDSLFYIITIGSNFLVFYLVFNYVNKDGNVPVFFHFLVVSNILVASYCFIQLFVGFGGVSVFGVEELSLQQNRADSRLMGPFAAAGITAEYLLVQTFILLYMVTYETSKFWRRTSLLLLPVNLVFLVATGNRTAVVLLFVCGIFYAYLFRHQLGMKRIMLGGFMLVMFFTVSAVAIINFSQFNVLFDRLGDTQVEKGLVDSRSVIWPLAWDRISDKPVLGHGPRLRLMDEENRAFPQGHQFMPFPHSLYLYILYTLGIVGLLVYLGFFFRLLYRYKSAMRLRLPDMFEKNVPRLAVLLWVVIMLDQVKVWCLAGHNFLLEEKARGIT